MYVVCNVVAVQKQFLLTALVIKRKFGLNYSTHYCHKAISCSGNNYIDYVVKQSRRRNIKNVYYSPRKITVYLTIDLSHTDKQLRSYYSISLSGLILT